MVQHYPYYAADPSTVRRSAFTARGGSTKVSDLMLTVGSQHQKSQQAAEGIISPPLVEAMKKPKTAASDVCAKALWASMWLEEWADAIEVFNDDSTEPPSITKLNHMIDEAYANGGEGLAAYLPAPYARPNGPLTMGQRAAAERHLQSQVDGKWKQLDKNLDDAAKRVETKLGQEPNAADIKAAWKKGNLPEHAALVWPDLGLDKLPITGVDPKLLGLTDDQVRERIKNQTKDPLTAAEIEYLNVNYPDVMADWAKNWKPEGANMIPPGTYIPGITNATAMCTRENPSGTRGYIIGPDGKVYPVQVPRQDPPSTSDIPSVGNPYGGLNNHYGDWTTTDYRQGNVYIGEHPPTALLIASGMTGFTPTLYGRQSITRDPASMVTYRPDGGYDTHEPGSSQPMENFTAPPALPSDPNDPGRRGEAVANVIGMAAGGLNGLATARQVDMNNTYASNVVFQTAPDGSQRAVIQLTQLVQDDEGIVHDVRYYGDIDENGNIVQTK